jgi:hypothetical protein
VDRSIVNAIITNLKAFRDRFAVERFDDRQDYGKERMNLLGMCEGVLLQLTYTEPRRADQDHLGPTGRKT